VNCWDTPKPDVATTWPVTAGVTAQKILRMKQRAISSQASRKLVEGSEIRESNLSRKDMKKSPRALCFPEYKQGMKI
jgi:hypothetical protein